MSTEIARQGLKPEILAQQRQVLRAFDLVYTPSGALAMVQEVSNTQGTPNYSIEYIDRNNERRLNQHNAWWVRAELDLIGNLIPLLAECMCHPFGNSAKHTYKTWNESLK